jgi:hypothetical protein
MARRLHVLLGVAILLASLAAFAPTLPAAAPPSCHPGFVFQNDNMSVWFHGKKGFVRVFEGNQSDESNASAYDYQTGAIHERDAHGRLVAWMNLERAYPQTSTCTITHDGDNTTMAITITDDVHAGPGGGGFLGQATVAFTYHFNSSTRGAKFDLDVQDWPWQSTGELDYEFQVAVQNGTVQPASNGIGFTDAQNMSMGYVNWSSNATAHYADGHTENATVASSVTNTTSTADVDLTFTNATAGYTWLDYDPVFGIGPFVIVGGQLVAVPVPYVPVPGAARIFGL